MRHFRQKRRSCSPSDESLLFSPLDSFCLEVSYPVVVVVVVVIVVIVVAVVAVVDIVVAVSTFFLNSLKKFRILSGFGSSRKKPVKCRLVLQRCCCFPSLFE